MKNIIKLFIVILVMATVTGSSAQILGIKGGLNLSNMVHTDDDGTRSDDYKLNPGFHIGATVEFPISEVFSFESGLLITTRGFKRSGEVDFFGTIVDFKSKKNLLYLEIPFMMKTYFELGGKRFHGALGPYMGIGLSGKNIITLTDGTVSSTEKEDIVWGYKEDSDAVNRMDFGLNMGAGIELNAVQIEVSYGLGLANLSSYDTSNVSSPRPTGTTIKNRVISISVGYKFGRS